MTRTQAFGYYAQNFVGLNERIAEADLIANPDLPRERLWQMRAREVVLATGAIERPLVFANNDRPAVMLADSARRYCLQYGAKVGERVVVATAHDSAYRTALDLKKAGVGVPLIVDLRSEAEGPLADAAQAAGIEVIAGAEILGADGRLRVNAVRIKHRGGERKVACDALLMSGGWTPSVHLFSQSRGKLVFDEALQLFKPGRVGSTRTVSRRLQRDLRSWRRARRGRRGWARGGDGGRIHGARSANLRCQRCDLQPLAPRMSARQPFTRIVA